MYQARYNNQRWLIVWDLLVGLATRSTLNFLVPKAKDIAPTLEMTPTWQIIYLHSVGGRVHVIVAKPVTFHHAFAWIANSILIINWTWWLSFQTITANWWSINYSCVLKHLLHRWVPDAGSTIAFTLGTSRQSSSTSLTRENVQVTCIT